MIARRAVLPALLLCLLFPVWAASYSPEAERERAGVYFDASFIAPGLPGPEGKSSAEVEFLAQMKQVLSAGAWNGPVPQMRPFNFRNNRDGWSAQAQSVGLEGFLWTKTELEGRYGEAPFLANLDDYFIYLDALLQPVAWTTELRSALSVLRASGLPPSEKNARLNAMLRNYVSGLQENMRRYDGAAWSKKARIYELFPRAYNLAGRRGGGGKGSFFRDFRASDFEVIKKMGFDTVWPMGILPIGVRGQTGTGGGSPYSISDHAGINPDLGTEEDFRGFVARAHSAGLRVIVDFVVNHTSLDSKLLAEDPEYFVSYRYDGPCPSGWFDSRNRQGSRYCVHHGGFEYGGGVSDWIDTAQVNYSNTRLRARMTEIVGSWVSRFDVDGFRVDMAYLALNNVFARTWQKTMPRDEFYCNLIPALKSAKPSTAFLAEAYAYQEDLGACGFDVIYSKNETARPEGQTGWYNTAEGGHAGEIQSAINRIAYLSWQTGGAGAVVFAGNHDEAAPERVFGERLPAVLALTMFYPGGMMMYSGSEIGYDAAVPNGEQKPLPFSVPCAIDWKAGDPAVKALYSRVLAEAAALRSELGDYLIEPLWPAPGQSWAGYIMKPASGGGQARAVIGNLTGSSTRAEVPRAGFSGTLRPGEYRVLPLP